VAVAVTGIAPAAVSFNQRITFARSESLER
jgi:hypothetical protein